MGQPLPPVARPGPKAWGGYLWGDARGAVAGPWAAVGGTVLGWSLGLAAGAAARHLGGTSSFAAALLLGLAAPLALGATWLARRRALPLTPALTRRGGGKRPTRTDGPGRLEPEDRPGRPQPENRPGRPELEDTPGRPEPAERVSRAHRPDRPERPAVARSVAPSALATAAGRVPAAPNTPRALLLHGEAALPQATGALLQVLAQVLAPCRVGLFHHDVGGRLVVRASRTTLGPGPAPVADLAGAAAGVENVELAKPGGANGVEAPPAAAAVEAEAWPEPVLQRLRQAAAARQAGALPAGAATTELWAAPILEAPREPGAGHLWGLLAVLRPRPQAWSHADVALLEGVAGQLALAWGLEQALRISRRHLQRLERIATTDGLTELINRRHFTKLFDLQLARARRYGRRLSLIFLDIDHFKAVNDTHGHQAGDEVLKKVAEVLRGTARCTDTVARLGGEEFAVLMEETGAKGAERYAERIRQALGRELFYVHGAAFRKTCSLGIATFPEHGAQAKELMARADQALYLAKRTGRNRTVIYRADTVGRESSF